MFATTNGIARMEWTRGAVFTTKIQKRTVLEIDLNVLMASCVLITSSNVMVPKTVKMVVMKFVVSK